MGMMTFAQLCSQWGSAYEWMWQDLDGLHLGALPKKAPPTSLMWGWPRPVSGVLPAPEELLRVRLDGETAFVGSPYGGKAQADLSWGGLDQVDQLRTADGLSPSAVRGMSFFEVREVISNEGRVPLTFMFRML